LVDAALDYSESAFEDRAASLLESLGFGRFGFEFIVSISTVNQFLFLSLLINNY
jgi:hypothetical protein